MIRKKRPVSVHIRLTPQENNELHRNARLLGFATVAAYLRFMGVNGKKLLAKLENDDE